VGKIETALISVSDKQGIVEFSRALAAMGVELVSTGGTAALLRDGNIPVKDVAELTGFPEMMDGRVKTLHPKIHGGILALRDNPEHVAKMKEHGIKPIDLVVVNLYPFEATVARGAVFEEIVENIDIGGPSMVRAAAKNHQHVGVVVDPADYDSIVAEMRANHGALLPATHFQLFCKAFQHTSHYDGAISNYFSSLDQDKNPQRWARRSTYKSANFKTCATARIRIRAQHSTAPRGMLAHRSRGRNSFKAKNCRSTTSSTPTRP